MFSQFVSQCDPAVLAAFAGLAASLLVSLRGLVRAFARSR